MKGNAASNSATGQDLEFRAPKASDVDNISKLLVDCFESDLKWFEFPERDTRRKLYRDMLQKSFLRRMEQQQKAADNDNTAASLSFMLLVEARDKSNTNKPIGFVQVGMLPPPPSFFADTNESHPKEDQSLPTNQGVESPSTTSQNDYDVPYIANLCVLPSYRKAGIGKKMVDICVKWLQKQRDNNHTTTAWENVFIAVDADNFVAKRFYEGIGFIWIEPPSDMKNPSRDYYFRPLWDTNK